MNELAPVKAQRLVFLDVLRLIAQNQVDLIGGMNLDAGARKAANELIAGRLNRTDRRMRGA